MLQIHFLKKAGGAPANVSAVISRPWRSWSFSAEKGRDKMPLETFLEKYTKKAMESTQKFLIKAQDRATTLAFVFSGS